MHKKPRGNRDVSIFYMLKIKEPRGHEAPWLFKIIIVFWG